VRPVSSLFVLSLRDFAANSFVNLLMAGGLLAWSLGRYPEPLGADRIAVYFGLILVGNLLFYLVHLGFLIPVFWTHSGRGLDELFYNLERFAEKPHQIYRGWLRYVLLSVLPFGVVVSVPAHALFHGLTWTTLAHVVLVAAGYFAFVLWLWKKALRSYASASS